MKTHIRKAIRKGSHQGFTLSEVMTAAGIGVIIVGMTLAVLIAILKLYIRTDIKNSVSEDYRDMTRVLSEQGNLSNGFCIYPSFADTDRAVAAKQIGADASGDFVAFVYYSVKDIRTSPNLQGVSRIVGFFREDATKKTSPIRWFDSTKQNWGQAFSSDSPAILPIPANDENSAIESLLPPASFMSSCPVLAQHTMGAVADTSATSPLSLFYNSTIKDRTPSFNVTGFIVRNVSTSGGGVAGYESQTAFNLTISPRSS